jgi:hypothetical protein
MRLILYVVLFVLVGCEAGVRNDAQSQETTSPYGHETHREVKSLSSERIDGLLSGAGLGYGRAAELNRYPGPRHVLDLADSLALEDSQREAISRIFEEMREEASRLGGRYVAVEQRLDALFASDEATESDVERLVSEAAELEGGIRNAHLAAHVRTREVMTEGQIIQYGVLRGYADASRGTSETSYHGNGNVTH